MLGVGEVFIGDECVLVVDVLVCVGLQLIELGVKEGFVLFNGMQFFIVYVLVGLFEIEIVFQVVLVIGVLLVEVVKGLDMLFDLCIYVIRGQCGQIVIVVMLCVLMQGLEICELYCDNDVCVQDLYCLCCQLQVMGVVLDILCQVVIMLEIEVNGVFDNLLVFIDIGEVLFGGNFYVELVVFVVDMLVMVVCEIGLISECCLVMLVDLVLFGLLVFLILCLGLNFGFMILQVIVVVLVLENKQWVYLVSVDLILILVNQEDYVLMVVYGVCCLMQMVENVVNVIGIELLVVVQGCDFYGLLCFSVMLESVCVILCVQVLILEEDCYFYLDMVIVMNLVCSGVLVQGFVDLLLIVELWV